ELDVPTAAAMGVAVEGSEAVWPGATNRAVLPTFDAFNRQHHFIEVFNKGKTPFDFTVTTSAPWIVPAKTKDTSDTTLWIDMDWDHVPKGKASGTVMLTGAGTNVTISVNAFNPTEVTRDSLAGFVEGDGYVSIEAEHYTRKADAGVNHWLKIDDYGRTLSGMRAEAPVDVPSAVPGKDSPCLEYQ